MNRHNDHLKSYLQSHKDGTKRVSSEVKPPKTIDTHSSSESKGVSEKRESPASRPKDPKPRAQSSRRVFTSKPAFTVPRKLTLDTLPQELLLKIFEYFEPSDLLTAARVCKRWLYLTNDNVLWQKIYEAYAKKTESSKQAQKSGTKKKTSSAARNEKSCDYWKTKCIQQCSEARNARVLSLLKKPKGFNGLPKQRDVDNALKKLGTRWVLCLTDTDNNDHIVYQSDVFSFQMSTCVRWFTLEFPSLKSLKKLKIFAANPVFFNRKHEPIPNSACQRSVMYECPLSSQDINKLKPAAMDDAIDIKLLCPGIMVATFKSDGEIAFITACLHSHKLVERSLHGTSTSPHIPRLARPPADDIDSQRGLHGYICCVELRNQRNSTWNQIFREVYCKPEYVKEKKGGRMARFDLIKEDCNFSHCPIGKRLTFPWKTDLFKGIVKDFSLLDMTLVDEDGNPMWTVSSPVQLVDPHTTDVTYDYDGTAYSISYKDKGVGELNMIMVWEPEIDQYMIKQMYILLALDYINHWFRTSY